MITMESWLRDKSSDGAAIEAAVEQRHVLQDAVRGSDGLLLRLKKHHDVKDVLKNTVDHPLAGRKQ